MEQVATITSKRQLTIPVNIFRRLNLKMGQKVAVSDDNGVIKIEPMVILLDRLKGSVPLPEKYKGLPLEIIIKRAKTEYFKKRKR